MFKVANSLDLPSVEAAYLVVAAPGSTWSSALEVSVSRSRSEREAAR